MSAKKKNKQEKLKEALRRRRSKGGHLSPRSPEGGPAYIPTPSGEVKMSEVLWEFVEPYLETTHDEQSLRNLLDLALIGWSIPLLEPAEQEGLFRNTLKAVPEDARLVLTALLAEMVLRKQTLFSDNTRMMLSYELTFTPKGPYLKVASTLTVG